MKPRIPAEEDEPRPEYDFDYSTAVRGKYYRRLLKEGANVILNRKLQKHFAIQRRSMTPYDHF
jgi:hypothetical protein